MPNLRPFTPGTGPGSEDGTVKYWLNGKYQVMIRAETDHEGVDYLLLSIRREDRKPIADWRDLQWIKNQLLGPEQEMVQLFPAESRLVDTSNQFWFIFYPNRRWPFGFQDRLVAEKLRVKVPDGGWSQQRPFAPEHRPADLAEQEEKARVAFLDVGMKPLKPLPREAE